MKNFLSVEEVKNLVFFFGILALVAFFGLFFIKIKKHHYDAKKTIKEAYETLKNALSFTLGGLIGEMFDGNINWFYALATTLVALAFAIVAIITEKERDNNNN